MRKSVILPGVAVAAAWSVCWFGGFIWPMGLRRAPAAHLRRPQSVGHGPCLGGGGGRAAGSEPGQAPQVRPVLHRRFLAGHHPSALRRPGPGRFSWPSAAFWPWPPGPAAPRYPAGTADDEHCLGRAGGSQPAGRRRHLLCRPENAPGRPPFSPPGPWSPALPAACGSWPTTTRAGRRSPCWVST